MPMRSWKDLLSDAGGANGDFSPIPDGDYDFEIIDAEAKQTANQKTMYVTKNKVLAGPHKDRYVWHNHVVSPENPNALSWFFRNMGALGLTQEYFAADPSDHQVAEALKGKQFRGQVTTRTWNGQEKNEIKQFFTARSGGLPSAPSAGPSAAPAPAPAPAPAFAAAPPAVAQTPPAPPAPAPAPAPVAQPEPAPAPPTEAAPPAAPVAPAAPTAPPTSGAVAPPPPPF